MSTPSIHMTATTVQYNTPRIHEGAASHSLGNQSCEFHQVYSVIASISTHSSSPTPTLHSLHRMSVHPNPNASKSILAGLFITSTLLIHFQTQHAHSPSSPPFQTESSSVSANLLLTSLSYNHPSTQRKQLGNKNRPAPSPPTAEHSQSQSRQSAQSHCLQSPLFSTRDSSSHTSDLNHH